MSFGFQYGKVTALIVSKKKSKGSAIVEFASSQSAVCIYEIESHCTLKCIPVYVLSLSQFANM